MIEKILKDLGLNENASAIYLLLLNGGASSARYLADRLGLPRPTVYDNLKLLIENGLVIERNEENKKVFQIDDIKNIEQLVQSKIESFNLYKKEVKKLASKKIVKDSAEPKIKFYFGPDGIKQVLKDLLWHENIETYTMWPISEMVEILGKEYLEVLNRRRIKKNISIKGIWPADKKVNFKDHPYLGVGKGHLRELRVAPKGMTWEMSYWLYENKVAFISSKQEGFGFVINSRDFANLIKTQFRVIWGLSTPIKAEPEHTDKFLKTV